MTVFLMIVLTGFVAACFSFLPAEILPFAFSSKILTGQHFMFPFIRNHYFFIAWALLCTGVLVSCLIPKHKKIIFSFLTGCFLVVFSPILGGYLLSTVLIIFGVSRSSWLTILKADWNKAIVMAATWLTLCILIPWYGVWLNPEWDSVRVLFLALCAIKVGTFLYDVYFRKYKPSFYDTWMFFLCPAHFLVIPSWIVCPFPSHFHVIPITNQQALSKQSLSYLKKGAMYLSLSIIGSVSYLYLAKGYLHHQIDLYNISFGSWIGANLLHGFLCFFYFFFVADFLKGLYVFFGYDMTSPVFDRPFLARNIFDFWNRFLIQTKEFMLYLFFIPVFKVSRRYLKSYRLNLAISLFVVLFFLDIPIHLLAILSKNTAFSKGYLFYEWYFALMSLFSFYFLCQFFIPRKIQAYGNTKWGRISKSAFWVSSVAFFY